MPRLLTSDQRFLDLFDRQAELAARAARLLHALFHDPTCLDGCAQAIQEVEDDADAATREVAEYLNRALWVPFDPHDMVSLGGSLADVVGCANHAARRATAFGIKTAPAEADRLSGLLQEATEELLRAVRALSKPATLDRHVERVKEFEEAADAVYDAAVARLFDGSADALEVIEWLELFDTIENALDRCVRVAHTLSAIALKHS